MNTVEIILIITIPGLIFISLLAFYLYKKYKKNNEIIEQNIFDTDIYDQNFRTGSLHELIRSMISN
jgi:hypothetical protein